MADQFERISSGILAGAAVVMAIGIAYRAFGPSRAQQQRASVGLDSIPSWREALPIGVSDGPANAPVTIVEFADLECPACRALQPSIDQVRHQYPTQVSVVWVNYPLSYHRFALGAAQAGVCAEHMGAFDRWRDEVYKDQDSLGLKSWGSMAASAGITDTASIETCARNPTLASPITDGKRLGDKIGVSGTPTVIINGWRFSRVPTAEQLKDAVNAELRGHRPTGAISTTS